MIRIWGMVLLLLGACQTVLAQAPPAPLSPPLEAEKSLPALVPVEAAPAPAAAQMPPPARQESLVTIDWVGASSAQVGDRAEHTLLVRNTSSLALHKVQANVRLVPGMTVKGTKPVARTEGDVLVWQLGTLLPRQEKSLQLQTIISVKGEVSPQAWVTFTGQSSSTLRIRVSEPKLALKVSAPKRAVAGEPVNFSFTVSNAGDGVANQVKVHIGLSEGLEYARGRNADFEVGDLAGGESRTVQVVCLARAGGEQKCEAGAESGGTIKVQDRGIVNVIVPKLEVELKGPGLRFVDRKAGYTLKVTNRGEIPASNTTVTELIPAGFKFVSASDGGRFTDATHAVAWFVGELAPGQAREVHFDLQAVKSGEHRHHATAVSDRGCKVEAKQELVTRVEDFSALSLEIAHADDALETGKNTTYEVIVKNAGSKMETDVKLMCILPDKMEFKGAQGPTRFHYEGNVILFDPLPKLAPKGDVIYQIKMKALAAGDVRFRAQVTSTSLVEPVIQAQAMRIYSDRP